MIADKAKPDLIVSGPVLLCDSEIYSIAIM